MYRIKIDFSFLLNRHRQSSKETNKMTEHIEPCSLHLYFSPTQNYVTYTNSTPTMTTYYENLLNIPYMQRALANVDNTTIFIQMKVTRMTLVYCCFVLSVEHEETSVK